MAKKWFCLLAVLLLTVAALAISVSAGTHTVAYIGTAAGAKDASSPANATNSLTTAFNYLDLTKDCTVVVCSPFTQSADWNYGNAKHYTGSVTFTSVYGGVDYRTTKNATYSNGGKAVHLCTGDTRFENMTFKITSSYYLVIGQFHPVTIGEGVTIDGSLKGTTIASSFTVIGGVNGTNGIASSNAKTDKDTNITVLSGENLYLLAFSRAVSGAENTGTAHITIGGNAHVRTLHGSLANNDGKVGDLEVMVKDNARVSDFYGGTQNVTAGKITLNWLGGTIGNWRAIALTTPGKTITYAKKAFNYADPVTANENFEDIQSWFSKPTVVYLKTGGTGSGLTPEDPIGTLNGAFGALDLEKDCTVVVCGSFRQTGNFAYASEYKKVTLTSVYDGVDYREQGAKYVSPQARFICRGETVFENLNICIEGASYLLAAEHHPVTVGEGVSISGDQLKGTNTANSFMVLGGYQNGYSYSYARSDEDVHITVLSGSNVYIIPFSRDMADSQYTGTAHITVGGNAQIGVLHGSSTGKGNAVGRIEVTVKDNAVINNVYVCTHNMCMDSYCLNWLGGSIKNFTWEQGSSSLTFSEEDAPRVLLASKEAMAEANFAVIAAKFDIAAYIVEWCVEYNGGHDYADGVCSVCGVAKCGEHPEGEYIVAVPATCSAEGAAFTRCPLCCEHIEEMLIPIDPDAHEYVWAVEDGMLRYVCIYDPTHILQEKNAVGVNTLYVSASGDPLGGFDAKHPQSDLANAILMAAALGEDVQIVVQGRLRLTAEDGAVGFVEPEHENHITIGGTEKGMTILDFSDALAYHLSGDTTFEYVEFTSGVKTAESFIVARHHHLTMGEHISMDFMRTDSQTRAGSRFTLIGGCYKDVLGKCGESDTHLTVCSGNYFKLYGGSFSNGCALTEGTILLDLDGDFTVGGGVSNWHGYTDAMLAMGGYGCSCGRIIANVRGNITCRNSFCIGPYGNTSRRAGDIIINLYGGSINDYSFSIIDGASRPIYSKDLNPIISSEKDGEGNTLRFNGAGTTVIFPFGSDWNHAIQDGGEMAYVGSLTVMYDPASRGAIAISNRFIYSLGDADNFYCYPMDSNPCTASPDGRHSGLPKNDDKHQNAEPTCSSEGICWYFCKACGEFYYETIGRDAHTFGEETVLLNATCVSTAIYQVICEECGHSFRYLHEEDTELAPHDFGTNGACKVCGAYCEHIFGEAAPITVACGSGTSAICTVCGYEKIEITDAAHDYGKFTVTVEPTATTPGFKTRKCKVCGKVETSLIYPTDSLPGSKPIATTGAGQPVSFDVVSQKLTKSEREALNALLQDTAYGSEIKVSYRTTANGVYGIVYSIPLPDAYAELENVRVIIRDDDGSLTEVSFTIEKGYIVFAY